MKRVRVAIGLIQRQQRFFLQRRSLDAEVLPGLWEFPGGKLEGAETPLEALRRELWEELRYRPEQVAPLAEFVHLYRELGLAIELHPFLCQGGPRPSSSLAWAWFTQAELQALPMPEANRLWLKNGIKDYK